MLSVYNFMSIEHLNANQKPFVETYDEVSKNMIVTSKQVRVDINGNILDKVYDEISSNGVKTYSSISYNVSESKYNSLKI